MNHQPADIPLALLYHPTMRTYYDRPPETLPSVRQINAAQDMEALIRRIMDEQDNLYAEGHPLPDWMQEAYRIMHDLYPED